MTNVNDLTGYEEHLNDEGTRYDYNVEAYGDRCPGCRTPRWGGDCQKCYTEEDNDPNRCTECGGFYGDHGTCVTVGCGGGR